MNSASNETRSLFARRASPLLLAWGALLGLMLLSLGSAYLNLGIGNAVAGLGIAAIKAAIVAWWFMQLRAASGTLRTVALIGLFMLGLLATLSAVDYATRSEERAEVQVPQQLEPLRLPRSTIR
jgi:cytochrome c oxidase subunit IV